MLEPSLEHIARVRATADCLYDEGGVCRAIDILAAAITATLSGTNPLVITLMNGGLVTAGQLLTRLDFLLQVDFIHVSRYHGRTRGASSLEWHVRPAMTLAGRTVLLVDDILDEGQTLYEVMQFCRKQGAADVFTAVLLNKVHDRRLPAGFNADFVGLDIDDRYVFGFGMDYHGYLRNAPGIYAVSDAIAAAGDP